MAPALRARGGNGGVFMDTVRPPAAVEKGGVGESIDANQSVLIGYQNPKAAKQHKQALDRKGIAGKRESDDMRRRAREQKEAWEHYGRLQHTVHNNDGCRRQKALLHNQRAQEYVQSRRVSERIVREREAEEAHRAVYVKQRAEAIRQDNVRAVKSVSASELKIRQKAADAMPSVLPLLANTRPPTRSWHA